MVQAREAVRELQSSLIREVANAGMGNPDILRFWFGESDQPTPVFIRQAAIASLESGETFYSQNLGRPYLREAIATYLSGLHEREIVPDRIAAVGSGVSALMIASQLVLSPGDKVVAVTPLWPNVVEIPKILGAKVTRVPLAIANGRWSLDLQRTLDALTPDTRMLIVNSPNNPTGWTIEDEQVDVLLAHCRRHGIWVLADDVYERLVYDPRLKSAPSFLRRYEPGDRIISSNSFSKAWTMTGWRMGWLVAPETLMARPRQADRVQHIVHPRAGAARGRGGRVRGRGRGGEAAGAAGDLAARAGRWTAGAARGRCAGRGRRDVCVLPHRRGG